MSIIIKGITKAQFYKDTNKIPYMDVGWDIEELPPHGRLIDADALEAEPCDVVEDRGWYDVFGYSHALIRNTPTIKEAEEVEK